MSPLLVRAYLWVICTVLKESLIANSHSTSCLQIYASPMYEFLDTKFGKSDQSIYSVHNWTVRLVARGSYLALSTFVAALLPFIGDFSNLTSSISTIPLTFVVANHMYIKVKGKELSALQRSWHWANIWVFSLLAVMTSVAAVRLIILNFKTYHVFADYWSFL